MSLKTELAAISGSENVIDDGSILEKYSRDYSLNEPGKPDCVVYARNSGEIQKIVKYANEHSVPVTPRSSGAGFYGAAIPGKGGIVLDCSLMNQILHVDEKDRWVRVEPGVTWHQLQTELVKHGMMVSNPLLPHPSKSVLTSTMEREPGLIPKYEYNETFLTAEMVMPNGDLFWTGTAIGKGHTGKVNPEGVIPSSRLFAGSQGTLGIATWATLRAVYTPMMSKIFFIPCHKVEDIVQPVYKILRIRVGNECLVLNNLNLATILARDRDEFDALREKLPAYTVVLCLVGFHRYPEKKIAYEEEAIREIARQENFELADTVADIPNLGGKFLNLLRTSWTGEQYWKFRYQGVRQDIFFHTTLDRVPEFTAAISKVAAEHQYPVGDISIYVQPKEHGRVCYVEYGFHCASDDAAQCSRVRALFLAASQVALDMGALFSNPYGPWADMVYGKATSYAATLKTLKGILDPRNIMNPGKLCF
jgi:FAD/FMN-containing dehydrogenase